jgi:hypothetical protein
LCMGFLCTRIHAPLVVYIRVCRWEKGVHIPHLRSVNRLAAALGVEVNDLVIWETDLEARMQDRKAS